MINALLKELSKLEGFSMSKAVFCLEHTGIYSNHLLSCLYKKKANICLESASQIKKSLGNLRGKNDKVDSMRIATYAYKNRDELRLWSPRREEVQQLAHLSSTRSRLIKTKKILKTPLKEYGTFVKKKAAKQNTSLCNKALNGIEASLEGVEKEIMNIVHADPELRRLFTLVTSVVGIGKVIEIVFTTAKWLVFSVLCLILVYCVAQKIHNDRMVDEIMKQKTTIVNPACKSQFTEKKQEARKIMKDLCESQPTITS